MALTATAALRGRASARAWLARVVVWLAFAIVAVAFGPRAYTVLASRLRPGPAGGPAVDLDLVGYLGRPEWLDGPLLLAVSRDLQPWLQGQVPILDEGAALRLLAGLRTVSWIADARLERAFPDRFHVRFGLRRPVLAVREATGRPVCLVDRNGAALPWVDGPALPVTVLRREGGAGRVDCRLGEPVPDDRVTAAAAVAVEWRDEVAPLVRGCPRLLEVDTTNLGERWIRSPDYPEVRVALQRGDGAPVVFGYDRPVGSMRPRIPSATKAAILGAILAEFPGLQGLVAGDLRFEVRWRSWLQPRPGA